MSELEELRAENARMIIAMKSANTAISVLLAKNGNAKGYIEGWTEICYAQNDLYKELEGSGQLTEEYVNVVLRAIFFEK